jgi:uncharacterized protein HemY
MLGYTRIGQEKLPTAWTALQIGEAFDPENSAVHLALGRWYYVSGAWNQAVGRLLRATRELPDSVAAHRLLAYSYEKLGKWRQAGDAFEVAIRNQLWDGGLYLSLSEARRKTGDLAGAREILETGISRRVVHMEALQQRLEELSDPAHRRPRSAPPALPLDEHGHPPHAPTE